MRICKYVHDAGCPIPLKGRNNFACFSAMENRKGVYVFQLKSEGTVLYIGRADGRGKNGEKQSGQEQKLLGRVQQHYRRSSGSNFPINWSKEHCECKGKFACKEAEDCKFKLYKQLLRSCQVVFFYFYEEDATTENIDALENRLIIGFWPKYNDAMVKARGGSIPSVEIDQAIDFLREAAPGVG